MLRQIIKNNIDKSLLTLQPHRSFFKIIDQNHEGVRLNFGKFKSRIKPGIRLCIPFYHEIRIADTRTKVRDIPKMQVISSDNVTFEVVASIQYKITDTYKALMNVEYACDTLIKRCKMELLNALSAMEINNILRSKADISKKVMDSLSNLEMEWGLTIDTIQINDIQFDESMKKAMAVKAEADRMAEAKIINARADVETAIQYNEAAKIYAENPITMRLRELQGWTSISKNPGTTCFVIPSNLLDFIPKK